MLLPEGFSGPLSMAPVAVATKKLTTEPGVKFLPVIVKLAPIRIGLVTPVITGWPGSGVGVGGGGTGTGVVTTHLGGVEVGVDVGVRVWVGAGVGVRVFVGAGVCVAITALEVGLGVGRGVRVAPGVKVGMKVGEPVTLNCCVALAAISAPFPVKAAVWEVSSTIVGVNVQEALPLASVVPKHELPSNVILTLAPATGDWGITESSLREATRVTGLPTIAAVGPRLSDRKLVCCPAVQVITDWLELRVVVPSVPVAVIVSIPAKTP